MERLIAIHDELLQAVARAQHKLRGRELTTFFPMQGSASTGELMIVGRAVNGWSDNPWTAADAVDPSRRAEIIREVVERSTKSEYCPMGWVLARWGCKEGYNTKKAAFWRVISSVSQSMLGRSDQWPSRLIWSNLYKVAPHITGNPWTGLMNTQQEACERHLVEEVHLWKPKRILFITGWNWARPFAERLGRLAGEQRPERVEWSGTIEIPGDNSTVRVVVSDRPEMRQEEPLVDLILRSFA
jgi:hypothetical protein